jgi:hypothetical protein
MRFALLATSVGLAACASSHATPPAQVAAAPVPDTTTKPDSAPTDTVVHQMPPVRAARAKPPVIDVEADPFNTMDRIDWPGPNAYRGSSGTPGPQYWQQRADYSIRAALDTTAKSISGDVVVTYTNNSPDTLHFVWMQVDQNIYKPGSGGAMLFASDTRTAAGAFAGGYRFDLVTVDGTPVTPTVDGTMMRLDLPTPIAPRGGKLHIAIKYSFKVPDHGSDRMGRDSTLYEIAQWYPRMAVYDDVRGWNTDQYLGQGEFYLEYGDIDYAVTAPAGYTIAGSGVLQNPTEVLSAVERQRLAKARASRDVIQIVSPAEAKGVVTPGTKTWRFKAQNVRDVAWAGAPDFRWDATSARGGTVLVQALYQWPKAGPEWEAVAEGNQWTINLYSDLILPFPYPQATSVAGTVSGMEYPMFVMDGYTDEMAGDVFRVNDHEHGHEWFPMIVGSNERRYAWMDEGINTYINAFSQERRYGSNPEQWPRGMDNFFSFLGSWYGTYREGADKPLMTMPDHLADQSVLGNVGYEKPAGVLLALRDHVVGPDMMDLALRTYARRWAYKHPTPGDFFRTVENVSGQDLSWFWRGYFYTTDVLDIGIDSVTTRTDSGGQKVAVIGLSHNTSLLFPVELRLAFGDGSTQDVRFPVDIWSRGAHITAEVPVKADVTGARLWPDRSSVPDVDPKNDVWGNAPPLDQIHPATTGGLAPSIAAAR